MKFFSNRVIDRPFPHADDFFCHFSGSSSTDASQDKYASSGYRADLVISSFSRNENRLGQSTTKSGRAIFFATWCVPSIATSSPKLTRVVARPNSLSIHLH
jgi:hypothetical protein